MKTAGRLLKRKILAAGVMGGFAFGASAVNLLTNGSFEDQSVVTNTPVGWATVLDNNYLQGCANNAATNAVFKTNSFAGADGDYYIRRIMFTGTGISTMSYVSAAYNLSDLSLPAGAADMVFSLYTTAYGGSSQAGKFATYGALVFYSGTNGTGSIVGTYETDRNVSALTDSWMQLSVTSSIPTGAGSFKVNGRIAVYSNITTTVYGVRFDGFNVSSGSAVLELRFDDMALRNGILEYFANGGELPDADDCVPPDVQVLSTNELSDHYRLHISYKVEDDDTSYAYLLLPKPVPTLAAPKPLVLCPQPTGYLGKDIACGIRPATPLGAAATESYWSGRSYGLDLVRRGVIVFAPDTAGYGERIDPDLPVDFYNTQQVAAFKTKWNVKWPNVRFPHYKQVWDIQRALDFLMNYEGVDTNNIGIIGHSLGGSAVQYTIALDPRIKAGVANAGMTIHFQSNLWISAGESALQAFLDNKAAQNLHNMQNVFIMATAPRPLMTIKPLNDDDTYSRNVPSQTEAYRSAVAYYQAKSGLGALDKVPFTLYEHVQKHSFEKEARELAYAWLGKQLMSDPDDP